MMKQKISKKMARKRKTRKIMRILIRILFLTIIVFSVGFIGLLLKHYFGIDLAKGFMYRPEIVDIVLDPGHGDFDPGANVDDVLEKNITLEIAEKTKILLENAGYKVALTREQDQYLELGERAEFANERKAKIFVSIHCNSSEDGAGKGIEIFYSEQKQQEDLLLAEQLQNHLIQQTSAKNRDIKSAEYSVLVRSSMPAVLIEVGFLTNSEERILLTEEEYQQKIAIGLLEGIEAYFTAIE